MGPIDPAVVYGAFAAGFALPLAAVGYLWRELVRTRRRFEASESPSSGKGDGPRILVVDDDPQAGKLMERVLKPLNVQITVAESAERARAILAEEGFALILVDVRLPGLQGPDLVRHLRPKVLLTSGIDPEELAREAKRCGADGFLPKDGNLRTLLSTIARMLDRTSPEQQD